MPPKTTFYIDRKARICMDSVTLVDVPDDFPRSRHLYSVGGAQPKLLLRQVQGRYREGWTNSELIERFDVCRRFAEYLTPYCSEKLDELSGTTVENLLPTVRTRIVNKRWGYSEAELDWILGQVKATLLKQKN